MTGVELRGARAVVLGLARSGEAAARALSARGASVTVLDAADGPAQRARAARLGGATIVLGRSDAAGVGEADLVVASPGVPPSSPWIAAALGAGTPVWSEVELAYRLGLRPTVGITGTNGKTTTTEMTAAALSAAGRPAVSVGNIGTPLVDALEADPGVTLVAELSSFQLWGIESFRCPVAVLLNVARDHLDWHGSAEHYERAKARLFANQAPGDVAVAHVSCAALAAGAGRLVPFAEDSLPRDGAGVSGGWIVVPEGRVVAVERLSAPGRAHRADAVAAAAAACALGADPSAVGEAVASYRPKPHRVETVAVVGGVTYVNDSKATDPHATLAALEELDRVVLIAGGRNRSRSLPDLAPAAPKLRAVVAIGEAAKEIEAVFAPGVPVEFAGTMDDAVARARALAVAGDTVLLSPACASLDMYDDYAARGEAFRAAVRALGGDGR